MAQGSPTGIPWVLADKGICARASLFLGTPVLSFTGDIFTMRCNERGLRGRTGPRWPASPDKGCSPHVC